MRIKHFITLIFIFTTFCSPSLFAASVYNSGSNTSGSNWAFLDWQYFGVEFSVSETTNITGIEGFFYNTGDVAISLFNASVDHNLSGSALYSFTINGPFTEGWHGNTSLNWQILSGTYFALFNPTGNGGFFGSAPNAPANDRYVQCASGTCSNANYSYLDLGVRINGEPTNNVPEPATIALMGLGFASMAARRRKSV